MSEHWQGAGVKWDRKTESYLTPGLWRPFCGVGTLSGNYRQLPWSWSIMSSLLLPDCALAIDRGRSLESITVACAHLLRRLHLCLHQNPLGGSQARMTLVIASESVCAGTYVSCYLSLQPYSRALQDEHLVLRGGDIKSLQLS